MSKGQATSRLPSIDADRTSTEEDEQGADKWCPRGKNFTSQITTMPSPTGFLTIGDSFTSRPGRKHRVLGYSHVITSCSYPVYWVFTQCTGCIRDVICTRCSAKGRVLTRCKIVYLLFTPSTADLASFFSKKQNYSSLRFCIAVFIFFLFILLFLSDGFDGLFLFESRASWCRVFSRASITIDVVDACSGLEHEALTSILSLPINTAENGIFSPQAASL